MMESLVLPMRLSVIDAVISAHVCFRIMVSWAETLKTFFSFLSVMSRIYLKLSLVFSLSLFFLLQAHADTLFFEADGVYYQDHYNPDGALEVEVTCENGEGAALVGCPPSYEGDVVVPETVTNEGITYTVASVWGFGGTGWAGWYFGGAFFECSNLTSIVLPSTIKSIRGYAFSRCTGLTSFTCLATTPPELLKNYEPYYSTENQFFGDFCDQATLYVPASAVEAYREAEHWCDFSNIVGIGSELVVGDMNNDGGLDVADVVLLIQTVLNGNPADVHVADVSGDEFVDISDVIVLIDKVLNGN